MNSLEAASPVVSQNTSDENKDIYDPGWVMKPTCRNLQGAPFYQDPLRTQQKGPRHPLFSWIPKRSHDFQRYTWVGRRPVGCMWAHVDELPLQTRWKVWILVMETGIWIEWTPSLAEWCGMIINFLKFPLVFSRSFSRRAEIVAWHGFVSEILPCRMAMRSASSARRMIAG